MDKNARLLLFRDALTVEVGASCAKSALELLESTLKRIEHENVQNGEEVMTISEGNEKFVQEYGVGGLYIPLIGHKVYINANGALKITDNQSDSVFLEKENNTSEMFKEVVGWKPKFFGA
ncbi:hypothetical protein GCM10009104_15720 [Marinobacterium maritimum]|uniref:Uncharacterized protein n=1 Tax=Marinobacterium maritimum TaxID=500162 RepID=A0ABP3TDY0_9GAMM